MENVEKETIKEMTQLLEKMAVDSFVPVITDAVSETDQREAVLINLKNINARYDKQEAITHIQSLMEKYNIQIDELLELIKY
jgi:hypothetical protein